MERRIDTRTLWVIAAGAGLFIISLLLPLAANVQTFEITRLIVQALENECAWFLLTACIRLVLMNTLRIVPAYLSALIVADFMIGEGMPRLKPGAGRAFNWAGLINFVAPLLLIPLVYMVIEAIYGIRYDFRMPAVLSIAAVVGTLRINRIEPTKNTGKAALVAGQLIFGFQWLDIVPALTKFGFGHGEISRDLKVVAEVLEVTSLLNFFGLVGAGLLILNGLIAAKFIFDYQERLRFAELERQRSLDMERIRAEAVLARGYREIQNLVHDLKTPLTTVQGLATVIAELNGGEHTGAHARRISEAAERMDAMIGEMMRKTTRRRVAAHEFAKQLAAHLPEEKTAGLVRFQLADELPDILINQIRLVRAVVNLIDNALDSGAKQVSVRFTAAAEDLDIAVVDDGAGMGTAALERCWEGGYSTKNSTGLGLMFVQEVVKEHKGSITLTSAMGEGTSCVITIPAAEEGGADEENLGG